MATKILQNTLIQKKTLVILSACIITTLFCVQNLQAEPLPQRGPIPFNSYDINSNGSISQEEFNTIRGLRMEISSLINVMMYFFETINFFGNQILFLWNEKHIRIYRQKEYHKNHCIF